MKFGWKILAILLSASVRPDSTDVAPWDADHARAMFSASAPTDTIGLAPAWSIAVREIGRAHV